MKKRKLGDCPQCGAYWGICDLDLDGPYVFECRNCLIKWDEREAQKILAERGIETEDAYQDKG